MFALAFVPVLLLAGQVSAHISARQSGLDPSDLPAACQSTCTPILDGLNSCTTDKCLCTDANTVSYGACLACLADLSGDASTGTEGLSQWIETCDDEGFSVTSIALSTSGGGASTSAVGAGTTSRTSGTASATAIASGSPSATFIGTTTAVGTIGSNTGVATLNTGTGLSTSATSAADTSQTSSSSGGIIGGGSSGAPHTAVLSVPLVSAALATLSLVLFW